MTCAKFYDRWQNSSPSTMAFQISLLKGFFGWLTVEGVIDRNPMDRIVRPRLPAPHERKVTIVTTDDVRLMLAECRRWQEMLCLGLLAYTGARRHAASTVRWSDVNMHRGTIELNERMKTITKPIPDELMGVFCAYLSEVDPDPNEWIIPNSHPNMVRSQVVRSDKVVWLIVKRVARRCGIQSTVHSIRAAFAVHYLEMNPGRVENLQALLGHSNIETTMVYLRNANRDKQKETVRSLSWGTAPPQVPTGNMLSELAAARRDAFPTEHGDLDTDPTVLQSNRLVKPEGLHRLFRA